MPAAHVTRVVYRADVSVFFPASCAVVFWALFIPLFFFRSGCWLMLRGDAEVVDYKNSRYTMPCSACCCMFDSVSRRSLQTFSLGTWRYCQPAALCMKLLWLRLSTTQCPCLLPALPLSLVLERHSDA